MVRCTLSALATTLAIMAGAVGSAAAVPDQAIIARDIVPSGQFGAVPAPPGALTQAMMYDALTPLSHHVTQGDVLRDFKPEPLNVASAPRPLRTEAVPHLGVTIVRDAYDVPYIHGVTRDDVTWGTAG